MANDPPAITGDNPLAGALRAALHALGLAPDASTSQIVQTLKANGYVIPGVTDQPTEQMRTEPVPALRPEVMGPEGAEETEGAPDDEGE